MPITRYFKNRRQPDSSQPSSITVTIAGEPAAICTATEAYLSPWVKALPERHPDRRLAHAKAFIAGGILNGEVRGPYDDEQATKAAHLMLAEQLGGRSGDA